MDEEVAKEFYRLFLQIHGCNIPLLGGDIFVAENSAATFFCTNKTDYNTTEGKE